MKLSRRSQRTMSSLAIRRRLLALFLLPLLLFHLAGSSPGSGKNKTNDLQTKISGVGLMLAPAEKFQQEGDKSEAKGDLLSISLTPIVLTLTSVGIPNAVATGVTTRRYFLHPVNAP